MQTNEDNSNKPNDNNNELTLVQTKALLYATKKAKLCHINCEYLLKNRLIAFNQNASMYEKLQDYMNNHVPMITHFNAAILKDLGKSNFLKNAFETNSKGTGYLVSREKWEQNLFNSLYTNTDPADRPKYATLNLIMNPQGGTYALKSYGKSFMVHKQHVRTRTTFIFDDLNKTDYHIATFKYCNHILYYMDNELFNVILQIVSGQIENSILEYSPYIGCHIHGQVNLDKDIESIHIDMKEKITEEEIGEFVDLHPNIRVYLL